MAQKVKVVFHNLGWRSWIECSFCATCPRSEKRGCCCYNPLFMPADLGYLQAEAPELIDRIFALNRKTVLDSCVIVDNYRADNGIWYCQFHSSECGCTLPVNQREFVCRRYVCSGMQMWQQPGTERWKVFFEKLEEQEAQLNKALEKELRAASTWLKGDRAEFLEVLRTAYHKHFQPHQDWMDLVPESEVFEYEIDTTDWNEWDK